MRLGRGCWKSNSHACGVDDIACLRLIPAMHAFGVDDTLISVLFQTLFSEWVTSGKRYRVTFA